MKNNFFIGCLVAPVCMLAASTYDEIGVNVGLTSIYNFNNNLKLDNFSAGANYQMNSYIVKPRFDLDYVSIGDFKHVSTLLKGSVNAIYEYDTGSKFIPYALGGAGYEYVGSDMAIKNFESKPFIQGGVGVGYDVSNGIKAKVEGKILQILGGTDQDNEVIVTAGVSFPLNAPAKMEPKIETGCPIKIDGPDEDRDGVEDSMDQCPYTPCYYTVDSYGCTIKATLHINFAVNSSKITSSSMPKVEKFADFLKRSKGSVVTIEGHTDSDGTDSSNLGLSQRRAEAVVRELTILGISPSRLTAIGYGESRPIATNGTKSGKALNRRIDAKLTYPTNNGGN